jgi:hypothetical protein
LTLDPAINGWAILKHFTPRPANALGPKVFMAANSPR